MRINPGSPENPSRQIAAQLRAQILGGSYQPGERLPSIPALTEGYGVAKQTVQRAIDQLRIEGLLVTKPGSGTYVRATRRRLSRLSRGRYGTVRGYHAALPVRYRRRVYFAGIEQPSGDVAHAFGAASGAASGASLLVRRHLLVDGEQPVEVGAAWLSPGGIPRDDALLRAEALDQPLYQAVEEATGRRYGTAADQITTRLATPDEAQLLRIRPDTPVLALLHIARDTHGDVIEVSTCCWPGPTSALTDEYQVPGPTPGQHGELTPPEPGSDLTLA
ncbi:MAG: GntR family transcriptional regulator [Micromonosporaceae bacterium]|nr:GntR family transcriptional regulator [Micromonosporaceae bacterium]